MMIHSILPKPISNQAFWAKLEPILNEALSTKKLYYFLADPGETKLELTQVGAAHDKLIGDRPVSTIVSEDINENDDYHHISYDERSSRFLVRIPESDYVVGSKEFGNEIARSITIANGLLRAYFDEGPDPVTKYLRPLKNLFMAPQLLEIRKQGFLEGVSADMWLGKSFWPHAKCSREEFLAQDWIECEVRDNGVIYAKSYHEPFTSREGEQGEIQRRLLDLLFGINKANPYAGPRWWDDTT